MDKNAIKKYAVWARRELISRVSTKALQYGITEKDCGNPGDDSVNGTLLTAAQKKQRQALIVQIKEKGYQEVMEEVAYTWFNRFSALRFMEVNGYLSTHVRVFTDEDNAFKPQIITEAIHLDMEGLDMEKVYAYKDADEKDELYKYLLIVQCNALSPILPGMFQRLSDYTELLFPDNLLREGSVIEQMIALIPEEDWKDAVQIIGWLYQYYNAEKKDDVFAALKKNIKITKENIPAATQLFTPDWIVRYMVENSLGRLWLEGHPNAELQGNWKYYLEEAEQEPEVQTQLAVIRKEYEGMKPEDIKCIDPCCGSGHILAYLFDVLVQIYEAYGYTTREAVSSIVENNLYGLDIDDRAAQLAYFAVMMKARQYDRRFFSRGIQPHVYAIQESNHIQYDEEFGDFLLSEEHRAILRYLLDVFQDAKEFGSILNVEQRDYDGFLEVWKNCAEASLENIMMIGWYMAANTVVPVLANQALILSQKYDVVVTNPPYMGSRGGMNDKLYNFINKYYADSKADLYSAFIEKCGSMTKNNCFYAMITQQGWLFLTSFTKLRKMVLQDDVVNMAHLGARAFDEINGEVVQSVSFVDRKSCIKKYKATYCRLLEGNSELEKRKLFLTGKNRFFIDKQKFDILEEKPIAYWLSSKMFEAFTNKPLAQYAKPRQGMATSDNNRFLRLWFEVVKDSVCLNASNESEAISSHAKWFPYNKGGGFRKWYGNNDYLINWKNNGSEVKALAVKLYKCVTRTIKNMQFYFQEGVTWSTLASGSFSARYCEKGFLFDTKGSTCFFDNLAQGMYITAFLNSNVANELLKVLAPTLDYNAGSIAKLPIILSRDKVSDIDRCSALCIKLAKDDWDSFETSWDFVRHQLVVLKPASDSELRVYGTPGSDFATGKEIHSGTLELAYMAWKNECEDRFNRLKANEEELNRIFIDIYGLANELTPEVDDKDVTVRKADLQRDIKSLISYAVGCMFGRYSLDESGLILVGQPFEEKFVYASVPLTGTGVTGNPASFTYTEGDCYLRVGKDVKQCTFAPDKDNIIPICDDEYFEDDIVGRFMKFIEVVYGKDNLDANLKFIADALGGKGQPKDVIRDYFLNGFYADHLKVYQKRPIYWLFDSGKKNGFKALIYMHRYRPDTIARIRTDYVHEQQGRYRTAIADLENQIASASTSERVKLTKKLTALQAQADEILVYEEKIHHLADQMIPIDLDDGVKKNYAIFSDVLAKIK